MSGVEVTSPRRYRFGPRGERRLLIGVRLEQVSFVCLATIIAVLILRSGGGALRIGLAFALVVVAVALSIWPVNGRTSQQWIPIVATFLARSLGSRAPLVPMTSARARRAKAFDAFQIRSIGDPSGDIGALVDAARHTMSGVIRLRGTSMLLLDRDARQRITDAWASTLGALSQHPGLLHRLSWIERTIPDHAIGVGERAIARFGSSQVTGARSSYLELLEQVGPEVLRHECYLVVTVRDGSHRKGDAKQALSQLLHEVSRRCAEVGIESDGLLTTQGLRSMIEHEFAPGALIAGASDPMPLSVHEEWAAIRGDGTWRTVYWIAEWPRLDVTSDFLMPLLFELGLRRTSVVVMEPRDITQAVRQTERARTEKIADQDLRQRHGFAQTARARREEEAITRRESELSLGHGAFRFSGYLSVAATDRDVLEVDCARLERSASRAHLVLRRLYGEQVSASTFALPAGRGR